MGLRVNTASRWKDGIIPYQFAEAGPCIPKDHKARDYVIANMRHWEAMTSIPDNNWFPIRFRPREGDEKPFLLITGDKAETGGTIALSDPDKDPTLLINYVSGINAIPHELGHIIGLCHENERNLKTVESTPYDEKVGPLLCVTEKFGFYADIIKSLAASSKIRVPVGEYDLLSIMHYPVIKNTWEFNCTDKQFAAFLAISDEQFAAHLAANHLGKYTLNYPTKDEVIECSWAPSAGDIETVRAIYK